MNISFKSISLVVFVVGCVLVFLFWRGEDTPRNYPPKNDRIVAFGDSLIVGYGATAGNDFVAVLGKKLGRNIVNMGVNGNTTADGLKRLDEVREQDPGVVLVLLGGNDTLRRVSQTETEANLDTIIRTLSDDGAIVVLLGVRGGIIGSERAEMYERLYQKYETLYVEDVLDGIILKPELMFDNIHPNDAGYARIAERVFQVFQEHSL